MEKLRSDVDGLKDDMSEIGENIRDIKLALLGNDFTGGKGIVHEMASLDSRLKIMERAFDKYKNILVGLSLGAGVGVAKILQMIVDVFTKH